MHFVLFGKILFIQAARTWSNHFHVIKYHYELCSKIKVSSRAPDNSFCDGITGASFNTITKWVAITHSLPLPLSLSVCVCVCVYVRVCLFQDIHLLVKNVFRVIIARTFSRYNENIMGRKKASTPGYLFNLWKKYLNCQI